MLRLAIFLSFPRGQGRSSKTWNYPNKWRHNLNSGNFENNLNLLSVIIQHTHAIIILSIILFVHKTNQTKSNPQFAVFCNLFGRKISSVSRKCIEQCYYNHVLPNELDTCDWCWCEQQLCRNKAQNRNFSVFLLKFISTMASSMLFAASPFILKHGDSYQQSNVNANANHGHVMETKVFFTCDFCQ